MSLFYTRSFTAHQVKQPEILTIQHFGKTRSDENGLVGFTAGTPTTFITLTELKAFTGPSKMTSAYELPFFKTTFITLTELKAFTGPSKMTSAYELPFFKTESPKHGY